MIQITVMEQTVIELHLARSCKDRILKFTRFIRDSQDNIMIL